MHAFLLPNGHPRVAGSLRQLNQLAREQVLVLTLRDAFLVVGAVVVALMLVLLVLPVSYLSATDCFNEALERTLNVTTRKHHSPAVSAQHADAQPQKQGRSVWPFLVVGILVLAFIGVVLWRIVKPSPLVTTDDARIAVHYTIVAPRVSGQVAAVHVDDNERVRAGQILVELDLRDLETAVRNAQATLARDAARVSDVSASIVRQPSLVRQAQSRVPGC